MHQDFKLVMEKISCFRKMVNRFDTEEIPSFIRKHNKEGLYIVKLRLQGFGNYNSVNQNY
jgi:hypothetical protein